MSGNTEIVSICHNVGFSCILSRLSTYYNHSFGREMEDADSSRDGKFLTWEVGIDRW